MRDWISVEDRLPEAGVRVLVYRPAAGETQDDEIVISFRLQDGVGTISPQGVRHEFDCWCHPTYWAPINHPHQK